MDIDEKTIEENEEREEVIEVKSKRGRKTRQKKLEEAVAEENVSSDNDVKPKKRKKNLK